VDADEIRALILDARRTLGEVMGPDWIEARPEGPGGLKAIEVDGEPVVIFVFADAAAAVFGGGGVLELTEGAATWWRRGPNGREAVACYGDPGVVEAVRQLFGGGV
jgi:hypothetical protein